jgi:hypothetical protein
MTEVANNKAPVDPATLEVERWHLERDCRLRELALKERDQGAREAEIQLRRDEQRGSTWRSPLTVAVFAAAVAGAGNAVVAMVNGSMQRNLETSRRVAEMDLERTKAESTRILEMLKTGDSEKAAANLEFLLKSGLVSDASIQARLTAYLATRTPGTGAVLPSYGNDRVTFDQPSPSRLQAQLDSFVAFLDRIGFPRSAKVVVHIGNEGDGQAYYRDGRIVIDKTIADDASVALREYGHHILWGGNNEGWSGQHAALESALADYFACSFLDNPRFGELAAGVLQIKKPQIRLLDNQRRFAEFRTIGENDIPYEGAEIWGGLFWELRARLGRAATDKLLAAAWMRFSVPAVEGERAAAFVHLILEEAGKLGRASRQSALEVVRTRRFPTSAAGERE